MTDELTNRLYYGDNLNILRDYIPDGSVDLVYLDPPFNSNRDYNVIFKDESGNKSDAQLVAFEDTWHWGPDAERQYEYLTNTAANGGRVPDSVSTIVDALRHGIGTNQMMAYLTEMTVRLVELHRVLKPTGSLYLHCDPTASHYLKVLLDAIFGAKSFRNEIVWCYTGPGSPGQRQFSRKHDTIFWYSKSDTWTFNADDVRIPHDAKTKENYKEGLTGSGFVGAEHLIHERGKVPEDYWQIAIAPRGKEYLGWPTQKPLKLLQRIIEASSNPGDVVLDPFCGCGTALVAAEKLGRRWIGIDVTYLSIGVMKARLLDTFGLDDVEVVGQPTEVIGAKALAEDPRDGRYQFQWWALSLVGAQPVGGQKKKGADAGIDGVIGFTDAGGKRERVIVSVKSGGVNASMIRDLKGTLEREKAPLGLFITLEEPSRPMRQEAAEAGFWHSEVWNRDYPKIQILSIKDLLEDGKKADLPAFVHEPFQKATKIELTRHDQKSLFDS
jgi:site-specific DNA-methyltransferase (adenine-specific)